MKVKVKEITKGCFPVRTGLGKSDCFDLFLAEDVELKKGEIYVARLGIAVELPKGMIARVYSRSSTPGKVGVMIANGMGFIDNAYRGDNDEWKAPLYALKAVRIPKGTRICQFEVMPSQFATGFQKLRWILSKPYLEEVSALNNTGRGGIGSTGK